MKFSLKNAFVTAATTGFVALAVLPGTAFAITNPFLTGSQTVTNVATNAGINNGTTDLPTIIGRIINVVLGFLGIVLLFYFIYGGFKWMTSGGDEKGVGEAKTMLRNAVIGLVIVMASYALSNFVLTQLVAVTTGT
jgi:hypothetical protein